MDSATEELRRQHIKTLEVLRRFADENARLREAAPCDAVALEKALLRLDARCAAGAAAAARDTMSMREQLATEQSRVQDLEAALANERAKAADECARAADAAAEADARCSRASARASTASATASATIKRLEADRAEATTAAERFRAAAAMLRDARARDAELVRAEADKARASAESLQAEKATLADRLRALTKERFVVGKREHELAARLAEAEALAEQRPPPAVDCMVQTDALPAPPPTSEFGGYVDLKRENARLTRELAELRKAHVALLESSAHVPRGTSSKMRASKLGVFS